MKWWPTHVGQALKENNFELFDRFIFNSLASPNEGAPAPKYGDVNTVTSSHGEVKGLILLNLEKICK